MNPRAADPPSTGAIGDFRLAAVSLAGEQIRLLHVVDAVANKTRVHLMLLRVQGPDMRLYAFAVHSNH